MLTRRKRRRKWQDTVSSLIGYARLEGPIPSFRYMDAKLIWQGHGAGGKHSHVLAFPSDTGVLAFMHNRIRTTYEPL